MNHVRFKLKIKIKSRLKISAKLSVGVLVFFILLPQIGLARTFNPNNIITDQELFNKNDLSQAAMQKFLERENSVLARYSQVVESVPMKASEMIFLVSQKHQVSPKFILTTLEKEQALISKSQATEKALDWATGYGCYGGGCNEKYRGFYNQIESTAETQEIYRQKAGQFSFKINQTTKTYDGYSLTPANQATANLFIYTPYVGYSPELGVTAPYGGNRLFWRVWHRYFSNQKFLDGQTVTDGTNFWLIQNNLKRKFNSRELFLTNYQLSEAISATGNDLNAYPDGTPINFADNTLIKSAASGQIYLLVENQKRPIIGEETLALLSEVRLALTASEITQVTEEQLNNYILGTLIAAGSIYPQGKLFKDEAGAIWQVKDNLKHQVDPAVWQSRFASKPAEAATLADLEKYPTGEGVKLKDGIFVLQNETGNYYLISNGERMRIQDPTIFDRVFGLDKKNNAVRVSTTLLEIHSAGEMIDYIDDTVKDAVNQVNQANQPSSYSASFDAIAPESLILITGQTQVVTVKFKNTGSSVWQKGDIWLQVNDKDKAESSFGIKGRINFNESSVGLDQLATFTINLATPTNQSGLLNQEFGLYYSLNGTPTKIISTAKFIIVKPGVSAQILEHNLPLAVKNTWRPIQITMKIKNTSADTIWLSRKTALEIYNTDGKKSPFYDANDWVRTEVAAVPINKTQIKPGETGEFKFTLAPKGIKKGKHILNIQLKLLDKNKTVYLNGGEEWKREIRVD
ncbi:MAG TPA: hypothetical protein VJG65_00420 [Patescibacteria group bacterium]|nr:hypothetical protein [Patescibacteria group bacterium]